MLDDLQDFKRFLQNNREPIFGRRLASAGVKHESYDLYCAQCGDARRMEVRVRWWLGGPASIGDATVNNEWARILPALFEFNCRECETLFTALMYKGSSGPDLVVLPSCLGGLSTPNTPESVRYFLDQAHRAQGVGARAAAMAMYRAALEHLLFDQEYNARMLGPKIGELQERIKAGTAQKWAVGLDPAFLKAINDLAIWSIHPIDGEVFDPNTAVTADVFAAVKATFIHLLDAVYERPRREAEHLATLKNALQPGHDTTAVKVEGESDGR